MTVHSTMASAARVPPLTHAGPPSLAAGLAGSPSRPRGQHGLLGLEAARSQAVTAVVARRGMGSPNLGPPVHPPASAHELRGRVVSGVLLLHRRQVHRFRHAYLEGLLLLRDRPEGRHRSYPVGSLPSQLGVGVPVSVARQHLSRSVCLCLVVRALSSKCGPAALYRPRSAASEDLRCPRQERQPRAPQQTLNTTSVTCGLARAGAQRQGARQREALIPSRKSTPSRARL